MKAPKSPRRLPAALTPDEAAKLVTIEGDDALSRRDRALRSMAATEMWVDTFTPAIRVACDGEVLTLSSPLHCQSWPRAITLFCPAR